MVSLYCSPSGASNNDATPCIPYSILWFSDRKQRPFNHASYIFLNRISYNALPIVGISAFSSFSSIFYLFPSFWSFCNRLCLCLGVFLYQSHLFLVFPSCYHILLSFPIVAKVLIFLCYNFHIQTKPTSKFPICIFCILPFVQKHIVVKAFWISFLSFHIYHFYILQYICFTLSA